jgi:hypothetical protein
MLCVDYKIVTQPIQVSGADACLDVRLDHLQHLRGQSAGDTHFFDFFGCFY